MNYQDNIYDHNKKQQKKTRYNPLFINVKLLLITICFFSLFFWMKYLYNKIDDMSINTEILNNSLNEKDKLIHKLKKQNKQNKEYISIIKQKEKKKKEVIFPKNKRQIKDTTAQVISIIKDTL